MVNKKEICEEKNKKQFWVDEIKPLIMWYCLEKHIENLTRININDNIANLQWTYDMIGQITKVVFEEYCEDDDNESSDEVR